MGLTVFSRVARCMGKTFIAIYLDKNCERELKCDNVLVFRAAQFRILLFIFIYVFIIIIK